MRSKLILIIGLILSFILINIFSLNSFFNNYIGKNIYHKKLYNDSIKYFIKSENILGIYNRANALYKQKKYKKAIKKYKSIILTKDKNLLFSINHNIGNIFYRFGELEKNNKLKIKNWEESIKYYSDALNIKYNEQTKKNLEFVLNKIKQEKKKKSEQEKKKKSEQKNSDKNKQKQDSKKGEKKQGKKENETGNNKGKNTISDQKNNNKNDKKEGKQSKIGDKQDKIGQKNEKSNQKGQKGKNNLSLSQEKALKKYQEALKKEQEKNQNNFNKVYRENNSNDPFSNFFNDPFFNNDLLKNGSGKKDW